MVATRLLLSSVLVVITSCATVTVQSRNPQGGTCTWSDGSTSTYEPARVALSGSVPRASSREAAENARPGVYDCAILANGRVDTCKVLESNGVNDGLALSALVAWTFEPARCGARAVEDRVVLTLTPQFIERCGSKVSRRPVPEPSSSPASHHPCKRADGSIGELTWPQRVSGSDPVFPAIALRNGQRGRVLTQCTLETSGALARCRLLCSDAPAGEGAVLEALKTWRMTPAMCDGSPVAIRYVVPVTFRP